MSKSRIFLIFFLINLFSNSGQCLTEHDEIITVPDSSLSAKQFTYQEEIDSLWEQAGSPDLQTRVTSFQKLADFYANRALGDTVYDPLRALHLYETLLGDSTLHQAINPQQAKRTLFEMSNADYLGDGLRARALMTLSNLMHIYRDAIAEAEEAEQIFLGVVNLEIFQVNADIDHLRRREAYKNLARINMILEQYDRVAWCYESLLEYMQRFLHQADDCMVVELEANVSNTPKKLPLTSVNSDAGLWAEIERDEIIREYLYFLGNPLHETVKNPERVQQLEETLGWNKSSR